MKASDTLGLVGTHLHKLLPQELGWISSPRLLVAYLWPPAQLHLLAQTFEMPSAFPVQLFQAQGQLFFNDLRLRRLSLLLFPTLENQLQGCR